MQAFSEETRRKMSESAKARCTEEWRKEKSKASETALNTELIRSLYQTGMTQAEIAKQLGVSQKVIWRHMRNHGIPTRAAAKRNQCGQNNTNWKGNEASYKAFHARVYKERGKAKERGCSICGRTDGGIEYDWANLTGHYEDTADYKPMCRACHRKYDNAKEGDADAGIDAP